MAARAKSETYGRGLKRRREVLGAELVDRAFAEADDFTIAVQEYVTEHAWGAVWDRPGLDLRTRSLITVAILAAFGIRDELPRHLRAAIRNGATVQEIKESLLQVAVYAGAPRAMDAFNLSKPIMAEMKVASQRLARPGEEAVSRRVPGKRAPRRS
jgi:4-carboxymuconolactone decarboxylase